MKREEIEHMATLARISLKEEEIDGLAKDITEIVGYVSEINNITTEETDKKVGALHSVVREDEPSHEPGEYTEAILEAAPKRSKNYIQVKKILDTGG